MISHWRRLHPCMNAFDSSRIENKPVRLLLADTDRLSAYKIYNVHDNTTKAAQINRVRDYQERMAIDDSASGNNAPMSYDLWEKSGKKKNRASRSISRVLSSAIISLDASSLKRSSSLPGCHMGHMIVHPYLTLLRTGFALPQRLRAARCALTAPFHPYRVASRLGGIFSAALSVGLRLPGVTWRSALWSPDFPLSMIDSDCMTDSRTLVSSKNDRFASHFGALVC